MKNMTHHRRLTAWLLLAAGAAGILAGAGCGGSGDYYRETEPVLSERESPSELESEQRALDERLTEALSRPEPDCASACELGDAICDLSTRICGIAERHPSDEQTQGRCADASARCEGARERIAAQCTCEAP